MSQNKAIWGDEEDFTSITTTEFKTNAFDTRGRNFVGVAVKQYIASGASAMDLVFEVSWDKNQWYALQVSGGAASIALGSTDINNVSPISGDEGSFYPARDGATPAPCPAPFVRLRVTATGSPLDNTVLSLRLTAWG